MSLGAEYSTATSTHAIYAMGFTFHDLDNTCCAVETDEWVEYYNRDHQCIHFMVWLSTFRSDAPAPVEWSDGIWEEAEYSLSHSTACHYAMVSHSRSEYPAPSGWSDGV
ncbi:hypothetical protein AVEN_253271-1 [Araneus ventricosus]|uniref:Uncharacterized protein n=1 Tax=Araneus ventricosus TaxID=182803 RepID=A0A4Y2SGS5_ARAVE|nr:hypothetical protein AVEN_253271-1 [Araneus ventricosus]